MTPDFSGCNQSSRVLTRHACLNFLRKQFAEIPVKSPETRYHVAPEALLSPRAHVQVSLGWVELGRAQPGSAGPDPLAGGQSWELCFEL